MTIGSLFEIAKQIRRTGVRPPAVWEPPERELIDIRLVRTARRSEPSMSVSDQMRELTEHGPVLWRAARWSTALTLCTAFARVAGMAGGADKIQFDLLMRLSHLPDRTETVQVAVVSYLFAGDQCRRVLSVLQPSGGQPHVTVSQYDYVHERVE